MKVLQRRTIVTGITVYHADHPDGHRHIVLVTKFLQHGKRTVEVVQSFLVVAGSGEYTADVACCFSCTNAVADLLRCRQRLTQKL